MVTAEQPALSHLASSGRRRTSLRDVGLMVSAAGSTQTGAALGAHAFDAIGPAGVVAVRQLVAALVLLPLGRPAVRTMRWGQWWPTLMLAGVFAVMNLAVYTTIDRIGLALAITLEFLGPLAVALLASRTRRDLITAIVTGAGVYVLVLPGPTSDLFGVGIGLFSAGCWAGYILLNRLVGSRLPGVQGTALATTISATGYLPVLVLLAASGRLTASAFGYAMAAGTLASVVPYTLDLIVLRSVSAQVFGIVMSAHPVLAALAGMVILGQMLARHEWVGIAVIVVANVVTVGTRRSDRVPAATDGRSTIGRRRGG